MREKYNYIVGIDFGTFSTSFSYARKDDREEIRTISRWPQTDTKYYNGRVSSSIIYKDKDQLSPEWGVLFNKNKVASEEPFFYAQQIKPYFAGVESLDKLPEGWTPVKLVADYLRQLYSYAISEMKDYFNNNDRQKRLANNPDEEKPFSEDQIRYVISIPDNQTDEYKTKTKEALIMAGIIESDAPKSRVLFITESEATAYYCLRNNVNSRNRANPSLKPYLVCDIGGTVFGVSTIEARELFETGKVLSHIDKSVANFGTIDLNKRMETYLDRKLLELSDDITQFETLRQELMEFFIENIKQSFCDDGKDILYPLNNDILPKNMKESPCIKDNNFIFSWSELKNDIFDSVADAIIEKIKDTANKFSKGIGGIFLSVTVSEGSYLENRISKELKRFNLNVSTITSTFVISEGLVSCGFREKNLTVPFIINKRSERQDSFSDLNSELSYIEKWKSTKFKDIDFIIGLDFGTTFSGFSYAPVIKSSESNTNDHNVIIKDVTSWPKQAHSSFSKIPSLLYYDENMNYQGNKFGEVAKSMSTKRNSQGILLRNFKRLLSGIFKLDDEEKSLTNMEKFEVVDAVAAFVGDFAKEGIKGMDLPVDKKINKDRLGYVVAIPSAWSHEAKNTMKEAIKRAELVPYQDFDSKVMFITEAEAAAIYCEKYFKEEFRMDKNQRFMICDAGGGTVDLATYEVCANEELGGELILTELTTSDSEISGSSYLDEVFRNYLSKRLDRIGTEYNKKGIDAVVLQFSREVKTNFEPSLSADSESDIKLSVPLSLNIPADYEDDSGLIIDNEISISYTDMENEIFKPFIGKILDLIEKQIKKLPEGQRQLHAILVIGGFGQSTYLFKKITDTFENKPVGAKFIGKPPNGDLAISRGAVSFGLEPRVVSTIITQYTYGLQVNDQVKKRRGTDDEKITGYNNEVYYRNAFSPIVLKNSKIDRGTIFVHKVYVIYPNDPIFAIYATSSRIKPKGTTDLHPLYKISATVPADKKFQVGNKIEFELRIEISSTDIKVDVYLEENLLDKGVTKTKSIVNLSDFEQIEKTPEVPIFIHNKKH